MSNTDADRILIQNLKLDMSIGIYEKERQSRQPVLITMTLDVLTNRHQPLAHIDEVVSYEQVVENVTSLATLRHYDLVEKFAEDIANMCLSDMRVTKATINVIKTDTLPQTSGVGIEISRSRKTQ